MDHFFCFNSTVSYTCITSQISFPKVFLSIEYLVASSNALCASPTAPAATCEKGAY